MATEGHLRNEMLDLVREYLQAFGLVWEHLTPNVWVLQTTVSDLQGCVV